jgi:beta-lactamase regulating signal transducer with metallopeptidase domain
MNAWATAIVWGMFQVTILAALGIAVRALAGRRGPEAGSLASAGTLLAVLCITLLAFFPMPPAWNLAGVWASARAWTNSPAERAPRVGDQSPTNVSTDDVRLDAEATAPLRTWGTEFWQAFVDEMRRAPIESRSRPRPWSAVALAVFSTGAAWGLFRSVAGATAVSSYRRQSRPIADATVERLSRALCMENGCREDVEVRETSRLSTAATVGCFRPIVLLPDGWRAWTREELHAVLAHEIAHVARGDYLTGLLAQVTLAFHFYHPLVHWLVRRLRLDQELAADARGMRASGGREEYLRTLAGMALRQDSVAISWAARPFLPTRGTLMRRIEMLRDSRTQRSVSLSRRGRALVIGTLSMAALAVAGLRPGQLGQLQAQSPPIATLPAEGSAPIPAERAADALAAQATPERGGTAAGGASTLTGTFIPASLTLDHVPANAPIVAAASPVQLLNHPEFAGLTRVINEQFEPLLGFPVERLQQVTIALFIDEQQRPSGHSLVLRTVERQEWQAVIQRLTPEPEHVEIAGQRYVRIPNDPQKLCLMVVDDRTLVIQPEAKMRETIVNMGRPGQRHQTADLWAKVAGSQAAIAAVPIEGLEMHLNKSPAHHLANSLAPLWRDTRLMVVGFEVTDQPGLIGYIECKSPEGTQQVVRTLEALRTLFQNAEPNIRKSVAAQPEHMASLTLPALNSVSTIIDSAKLTADDRLIEIKAEGSSGAAAALAVLAPAVQSAREAARRAGSLNNLKQIALAMHMYHDTHRTFPPAVVIGPDGQTPHSWRVALLPFLGQEALYRQYQLGEPWDSENNRQVLAQMPAVYRHPQAARESTNSSYYVLTGDATIFHGTTGCSLPEIQDGTSNTLLLVEAKRDIPWTRPDDIPLDSLQGVSDLAGYHHEGVNVALADGSARFLSMSLDAVLFRSLATKAGGEIIELPQPR